MRVPGPKDFGFAKVKGQRAWPARRVSENTSNFLVSFYGSDKFDSVSKKNRSWKPLSVATFKKFCRSDSEENKWFSQSVKDMVADFAKNSDKNSIDKDLTSYLI